MCHLVSIYRWELFLLFALPAVDGLLDIAVVEASLRLAAWFDYECTRVSCESGPGLAVSVLLVAVLAATYPFVRRQGRQVLTLLWQLEIALRCVSLVLWGVQLAVGDFPRVFDLIEVPVTIEDHGSGGTWWHASFNTFDLVRILVYAWFIRRASRISASHALLLFAVSMADSAFGLSHQMCRYIIAYPTLPYIGTAVFHLLTEVGVNVLMFRALIRCDALTPASRMRTAAVLIVAAALENLLGWFLWWAMTFGPFLLGAAPGTLAFSPIVTAVRALEYAIESVVAPLALGYLVCVRRRPDGEGAEDG